MYRLYTQHKGRQIWNLINRLKRYDLLILTGVNALLLSIIAGQENKTIFWPSGGDFRMISNGEGKPSVSHFRYYLLYLCVRKILSKGLKNVLAIASHDPVQDYCSMYNKKMQYLPFPLPVYQPVFDRNKVFKELDLTIDFIKNKIIFFMPSRIDFYWKKNDLFLEAFMQVIKQKKKHKNLLLICSGWGKDKERMKDMIPEEYKENIIISEYVFSLPLLYDIYYYSDVVVDQFQLGSYGTSAVGAFSCGKPVLMYINEMIFKEKGFPVPPVINCKTKEDIVRALIRISSDRELLTTYKEKTKKWFKETHHNLASVEYLKKILNNS